MILPMYRVATVCVVLSEPAVPPVLNRSSACTRLFQAIIPIEGIEKSSRVIIRATCIRGMLAITCWAEQRDA